MLSALPISHCMAFMAKRITVAHQFVPKSIVSTMMNMASKPNMPIAKDTAKLVTLEHFNSKNPPPFRLVIFVRAESRIFTAKNSKSKMSFSSFHVASRQVVGPAIFHLNSA